MVQPFRTGADAYEPHCRVYLSGACADVGLCFTVMPAISRTTLIGVYPQSTSRGCPQYPASGGAFARAGFTAGLTGRLCHRKWLMFFSLKFQRDDRKNASARDSANGKLGRKAVFLPSCGDEATTYDDSAYRNHPFLLRAIQGKMAGQAMPANVV